MASNNYKLEIDRLQQVIKIQDISIEQIENDPNKLHSVNARAFVPKKYFKKVKPKIDFWLYDIYFSWARTKLQVIFWAIKRKFKKLSKISRLLPKWITSMFGNILVSNYE